MNKADEWPPRFTITPEGAAGLFLMTHCPSATIETRDTLVELMKLYYEAGFKNGVQKSADKIEQKYKTFTQPWRAASTEMAEYIRRELKK